MSKGLVSRGLVALVLTLASLAGSSATGQAEETEPPVRIMLYGDSQTMGSSGDWTWRYRLWQHLTASGTAFDFVGPRTDVAVYTTKRFGSQGYRDPAFDRDHAAIGGMYFTQAWLDLSTVADTYSPDVVIGLIGGNDLLRWAASPEQLTQKWRTEIAEVRASHPGTSFVLVQQPVVWIPRVPDYNARMVALAGELDTPESRVVTTGLAEFDPYLDTFDMVHPSASGERKIADQVAGALASIGVGAAEYRATYDPQPVAGAWAPRPWVTVASGVLDVSWAAVNYASAQDVHVLDLKTLISQSVRVRGTHWSTPVESGHHYRVWLKPVKGYLPLGTRSIVSARITVS